MRRKLVVVAVALALVSTAAFAIKKGDKIYVRTKDAKLLAKPDAKSKTLGVLKVAEELEWDGTAPNSKDFHQVKHAGVVGYTLRTNLSPNKPQDEIADDGKPIDQKTFASSGAATKAVSGAGLMYAGKKQTKDEMVRGLISAEAVSQSVSMENGQAYVMEQTGGGK